MIFCLFQAAAGRSLRDLELHDLYIFPHTSMNGVFNQVLAGMVGANRLFARYEPDESTAMVQDNQLEHMAAQECQQQME